MSITMDELRRTYTTTKVEPYGEVIVVPGDQFNPDWEVYLGDKGFKMHFVELGGKAVTLVETRATLPEEENEKEEEKKEDDEKMSEVKKGKSWSEKDDGLLISLWNKGMLIAEIAKGFPGRSENAVKDRIDRLKQNGTIKRRYKRKTETHEACETKEKASSQPTPYQFPPFPITVATQILKCVQEIRDSLVPKTFTFDTHCRQCGDGGHVEEAEKVWKYCPICGEELIINNLVEAPKAKNQKQL